MRGRKPIPTNIVKLRGTFRKYRHLRNNSPAPALAVPQCPDFLNEAARAEWNRVVPELHAAGLLTRIDYAILSLFCVFYARWAEAERKVSEFGIVLPPRRKGTESARTGWLFVANTAAEQIRKLLPELGMTPSARSRIDLKPISDNSFDPAERYFKD